MNAIDSAKRLMKWILDKAMAVTRVNQAELEDSDTIRNRSGESGRCLMVNRPILRKYTPRRGIIYDAQKVTDQQHVIDVRKLVLVIQKLLVSAEWRKNFEDMECTDQVISTKTTHNERAGTCLLRIGRPFIRLNSGNSTVNKDNIQ